MVCLPHILKTRQMIRAAKGTCAELTAEGLQAGVLPVVPGQLVRPGEPPNTSFPGADGRQWRGGRLTMVVVRVMTVCGMTQRVASEAEQAAGRSRRQVEMMVRWDAAAAVAASASPTVLTVVRFTFYGRHRRLTASVEAAVRAGSMSQVRQLPGVPIWAAGAGGTTVVVVVVVASASGEVSRAGRLSRRRRDRLLLPLKQALESDDGGGGGGGACEAAAAAAIVAAAAAAAAAVSFAVAVDSLCGADMSGGGGRFSSPVRIRIEDDFSSGR
uniref:Uncharacterized protein n=1 Tax=Anopheles farauti TaxID=69004 RepID=A0A182QDI8_9DIPT